MCCPSASALWVLGLQVCITPCFFLLHLINSTISIFSWIINRWWFDDDSVFSRVRRLLYGSHVQVVFRLQPSFCFSRVNYVRFSHAIFLTLPLCNNFCFLLHLIIPLNVECSLHLIGIKLFFLPAYTLEVLYFLEGFYIYCFIKPYFSVIYLFTVLFYNLASY